MGTIARLISASADKFLKCFETQDALGYGKRVKPTTNRFLTDAVSDLHALGQTQPCFGRRFLTLVSRRRVNINSTSRYKRTISPPLAR